MSVRQHKPEIRMNSFRRETKAHGTLYEKGYVLRLMGMQGPDSLSVASYELYSWFTCLDGSIASYQPIYSEEKVNKRDQVILRHGNA